MKITSTLILGVFAAFALSTVPACDDKKDEKKAEDKKDAKDKKDEKKTDAKPADAKPAEAKPEEKKEEAKADAPAGGGDKIGVAECDEYIEKYTKCIMEKVPEAARAGMITGMEASVKAFREAAAGPGKDTLAATCKASLDAVKQSTTAMGCVW